MLKYKYKIVIFKRVDGRYKVVGKDRAMEMKIGDAGDTAFALLKNKKIIPLPSIQTGNNSYWFAVGDDNEWFNIGIGDLDKQRREMKLHFTDKEMRHARTSLQGNLKERLIVKDFWAAHGGMIMQLSFIVIIGIMVWLMMDKWLDVVAQINAIISNLEPLVENQKQILVAMENLQKGGSGLVPSS